ncbi:MAG: hypothetical protein IR164_00050 [Devosia sp.]|uniref:flagellar biosynthesis repressor FlbT n=1 Tax=Devosia sp. TaxID=1871048 RepID=UPI0019EAF6E5|nr:flagellar biosynthesis repressor FlbT [Devosia sp.]MBF0677309.1 hypothetical protein [Devosia sp.]
MSLRIVLKPGEQLYIGSARVSVDSPSQTRLIIEGELPVVRERDYLAVEKANSTARKLYLVLQLAYLNSDFGSQRDEYFRLAGMLMSEKPAASSYIVAINSRLGEQKLYAALKEARALVQSDEGQTSSEADSPQWDGL